MKTQTGIWIDGTKALVIAFRNGKETICEIESGIENSVHHKHEGDKGSFTGNHHHINNDKKFSEIKHHEEDRFLDKVVTEVKEADELFLMGPSQMKKKLRARIESDKNLLPKYKGMMSTDYISLNQCVEKVRHFYEL
jgi:hypothetical protein